MKKAVLVIGMALMSLTSFAQTKVGTINVDYILSQMPEMAQVNEGVQAYNGELQKELETTIGKYETVVKDYQANSASYSEEDKKSKENEIISLENDIKGFRNKATVMLQMKRNELSKPLYEKINEAMAQVIEAENYTQIFHATGNSIAYASEEFDITLKVMEKLGLQVE
jgi:outer membrane protein